MWNIVSVRLETVLIFKQDRCMVWAKHTMAMEIILDAADETPRCVGHLESRFGLFRDSVSVGAR
jgi:hypothetical protein